MKIVDFLRKNIFIVIALLIIIGICVYYYIRDYRASITVYFDSITSEYVYEPIPRVYKVNEYAPVNVTNENAAKLYYNNYMNLIRFDIQVAYSKLNEQYRKEKFPTLDSFKSYVEKNKLGSSKLSKYGTTTINGDFSYILTDTNENMYVFITDGVMQYTVMFDIEE